MFPFLLITYSTLLLLVFGVMIVHCTHHSYIYPFYQSDVVFKRDESDTKFFVKDPNSV